jgi:hypothetical protein
VPVPVLVVIVTDLAWPRPADYVLMETEQREPWPGPGPARSAISRRTAPSPFGINQLDWRMTIDSGGRLTPPASDDALAVPWTMFELARFWFPEL